MTTTSTDKSANQKRWNFHEAPLLFAIFLDLVGFGMVIPDVQTRLESFGAKGFLIGLVLSSYFLTQILVSPLWGRYSDKIGRKPVLVVCGTLSAFSMLAYAFADGLWFILASRILAGFAAANTVVAQAYIADATDEGAARTAAMGRVGAAITAGLMLGPALGGWLADTGGNRLLGFVAAGASGLGALWIALVVRHVVPVREITDTEEKSLIQRFGLTLWRDAPRLRPLFALASAGFFALACLEGTFGRLIHKKLGYGPSEFGLIFGYESFLGVVVQSLLLAVVTKQVPPRPLLSCAYVLQGIGLALTPLAPNLAALFGISTIYAVGAGFANPTINSLTSALTPKARQGEMFGLLQGARSFGFLVGPTVGGVLFDWRPDAPYFAAGLVLLSVAAFVVGSPFIAAPPAPPNP